MQDKITPEKLAKYFSVTESALKKVKENIIEDGKNFASSKKTKDSEPAKFFEEAAAEIISMASNYVNDAKHFESKGDLVNAFGALNYAHGWIDAGVRLGIFDVDDDKLFTVR